MLVFRFSLIGRSLRRGRSERVDDLLERSHVLAEDRELVWTAFAEDEPSAGVADEQAETTGDKPLRRGDHAVTGEIGDGLLEVHRRRTVCRTLTVVVTVLAAAILAGSAWAKATDPRKCSTLTPGGSSHHAYWCAHGSAVATVRSVMARRQGLARWYSPTFCDQNGTLLRWACTTIDGGQIWKVAVTWRATSTGWHRYASVTKTA